MRTQQRHADYYDALPRWGTEPDEANRERIQQTLSLVPVNVRSILDLGCGDGTVSNHLVDDGSSVVGVDISFEALRYFKGKGIIGSLEQLPFKDNSFDLVICAEVLEHLPIAAYEFAKQQIERVARDYVIVSTPNQEELHAGFGRCANCKIIFHTALHLRAFDRKAHQTLFRGFDCLKTIEIEKWKRLTNIYWLEHSLLGVYRAKEGRICPHCGHRQLAPKLGIAKRIVLKGFRMVGELFPPPEKAHWIASLYKKRNFSNVGEVARQFS